MNRATRCVLALLFVVPATAQEPGQIHNGSALPPETKLPPPRSEPERRGHFLLHDEFLSARGFSSAEIQAVVMSINRMSCLRRVFSPSGLSLNGDGDLMSTQVAGPLHQLEFRTEVYLGDFNPFRNGVDFYQTIAVRRLMNFASWVEGQPLRIAKQVALTYDDVMGTTEAVNALDEVRILGDNYPPTYIVRETIFSRRRFHVYFVCQ
jgi:hypothetical protein